MIRILLLFCAFALAEPSVSTEKHSDFSVHGLYAFGSSELFQAGLGYSYDHMFVDFSYAGQSESGILTTLAVGGKFRALRSLWRTAFVFGRAAGLDSLQKSIFGNGKEYKYIALRFENEFLWDPNSVFGLRTRLEFRKNEIAGDVYYPEDRESKISKGAIHYAIGGVWYWGDPSILSSFKRKAGPKRNYFDLITSVNFNPYSSFGLGFGVRILPQFALYAKQNIGKLSIAATPGNAESLVFETFLGGKFIFINKQQEYLVGGSWVVGGLTVGDEACSEKFNQKNSQGVSVCTGDDVVVVNKNGEDKWMGYAIDLEFRHFFKKNMGIGVGTSIVNRGNEALNSVRGTSMQIMGNFIIKIDS